MEFPQCNIAPTSMDRRPIHAESPKLRGTLYYNKNFFYSIVLLTVCDADYCFTMYDFGSYGSNHNGSVLANSTLGKRLQQKQLNLSPEEPLNGYKFSPLPYFLLGDDIFLLKSWLMKPYPGIN